MCIYCKAASEVLDTLWQDSDFRTFFHDRGYDLSDLGPMTHDVFVPAYWQVKGRLRGGVLEMLEAQVMDDVLVPLAQRPGFRAAWDAWDQRTRDVFLREQSEMRLARLVIRDHELALSNAYRQAFLAHISAAKA